MIELYFTTQFINPIVNIMEFMMITKLYIRAQQTLINFKQDQRGVTAIEYAVLAVAIAAALTATFGTGSATTGIQGVFTDALKNIKDAL